MTTLTTMTLHDLTRRIGEFGETPFKLGLRFGDYDLAIVANNGPIIEKLRNIFPSFVDDAPRSRFLLTIIDAAAPDLDLPWSPASADTLDEESDEEICDLPDGRIVRRRSKGILFASGDAIAFAILPCAKHGNKLVNFINSRYIQWQLHRGGVLAHASSVTSERKGLVLAGAASSGKTTLAFQLLDRGFLLVGKDNVIVRRETPGLRMYGTPAPPRVNPGTALHSPRLRVLLDAAYTQKLARLSREELWGIEKKHEVFVEALYGAGSTRMDGAVDGIVVLNWQHAGGPTLINRVDLGQRPDLLAILMKGRGRFYWSSAGSADPEPGEKAYLDEFGDCPVYEITGGIDFDQAGTFCASLL